MTRRTRLFLGWIAILALLGGVALPFLLRAVRSAGLYERAAACAPGQDLTTPCRQTQPATVERLYTEGTGRRQILLMQAQLGDGAKLRTQIPSPDFWQSLEQGSPITVEVWRGQVMRVRALGRDEPTSDNPSWRLGNARAGLIAVSGMIAFMAALIALALRFGRPRVPRG